MIPALVAILAGSAVNAHVAPKPNSEVFSCSVGDRYITVRAMHNTLIYRLETGKTRKVEIIGAVNRGNLHFRAERYFSMEYQLRFSNGPYSYVVYSIGSNPTVDARGASGVVVMKGTKRISDLTCKPWANLNPEAFALWSLPMDGEAYSAM